MELILLEKVHNLGDLGDTVTVKPGYGRNFLLPRGKAVPATRENKEKFEAERGELQRQAGEKLASAEARREAIDELESILFSVNVSPEGRLYGSISAREIADKLTEMGYPVEKVEVDQPEGPIRETGEYTVGLILHAFLDTLELLFQHFGQGRGEPAGFRNLREHHLRRFHFLQHLSNSVERLRRQPGFHRAGAFRSHTVF
jgi:large subunit ribosomal protein L9